MSYPYLLHHLLRDRAAATPDHPALSTGEPEQISYARLQADVEAFAARLMELEIGRGERVAVFLDKRPETVVACFGSSLHGAVFVPVNPILKPEQVAHILGDCEVSLLVTDRARLRLLEPVLAGCHALRAVMAVDAATPTAPMPPVLAWPAAHTSPRFPSDGTATEHDTAAILYTSGSTGRPKGVVLSHRNLVVGALSVTSYLGNNADDTLLAALPLSFDAGFSQLTTAFAAGARVVLLNYLLPRDVLKTLEREKVTGLTAVPPLWIQLARLDWPAEASRHLRYFANTGGHMPRETLAALRARAPQARPYLMYGLTEAFRATYLPPEEVDRRPDSIGKAIPNTEILVLREDGTPCAPGEPGELVQRGPLVAQGYWNDPIRTAERFQVLPAAAQPVSQGRPIDEVAVFSGDTVRTDAEGFLYFVGRRDEMIKTSGYRVSPGEVEEVVYRSGLVLEAAAFGRADPILGQHIVLVVQASDPTTFDKSGLAAYCRAHLPGYMLPAHTQVLGMPLPRNPNGKIDRARLASEFKEM